MNTPDLKKGTSAAVELIPYFAMDGSMVHIVVVKQRFVVDRRGRLTRSPGAEVRIADEPWDKEAPETSSIHYPSDLCLRKPSTDIVVAGSAMSPTGRRTEPLDVLVRVGAVEKTLRVHGPRVWRRGALKMTPGPSAPFESVPLQWELAFGGGDEARNPVGRGVARDLQKLEGQPAPQIDDPSSPVSSAGKGTPAGVGAIGRSWMPRRQYAGTSDERWQKERMPLPPLDFDDRFNQVASPDLIAPQYLRGGERVEVVNMSAPGPLQFELPKLTFFVGGRTDSEMKEYRPVMDTLLLEPNARSFEMTWRTTVPVPRRANQLRAIQVHEKVLR